jgi:hypothetical protein
VSITDDVQHRSAHIHWPADADPDRADLFAHNDIVSTVHEFEPASRIGWYGTSDKWLAYHTWLLMPRPDGSTYVVMEETGDGANPRKLAEANPGHMHRGHDLWNISLKFLCES